MPEVSADITARSFQRLIARLGAYITVPFQLVNYVLPVSIVDADIVLAATSSSPVLLTPASAGELDNPASNARCADTGALPAGTYYFLVLINVDLASLSFRIRRRNSVDGADIWSQRCNFSSSLLQVSFTSRIEQSERLVVENITGPGSGLIVQVSIFPVLVA